MTDMTPPDGPDKGDPAALLRPQILTRRRDFIATSHGRRQGTAGIHLQGRRRDDGSDLMRVGYTCSKKVGNAVARNRAKRRLRAIARLILPKHGRPGWDYVLVGRPQTTATLPFTQLQADLIRALDRVHQ
ncbi:ribonuclease P protein component [Loktanella atrilutea]|uniref:Ribonuclease P protein component n=1 Tax=Loktanella atrilutea TaxID=366533 RepID=A0A1M5E2J5_LOKAT|nr:ribonuclease P protein component [Loktanella atrilutea]SHF73364.1 ribonuclease P protein component [Loktanella atrilutea]